MQTEPPSLPIDAFFPSGLYPEGEHQEYVDNNSWRTTSAECRERDRLASDLLNDVRCEP